MESQRCELEKKFIVKKKSGFKMFDSKYVIYQVEEFQLILHEILVEDMISCEMISKTTLSISAMKCLNICNQSDSNI